METLSYYSEKIVDLTQIARLALSQDYIVQHLSDKVFGSPRINILFGQEKHQWWQWHEATIRDIYFDEPDEEQIIKALNFNTIMLIEYYSSSIPMMVTFLELVMGEYGGWVDCIGDARNLKTKLTLKELIDNVS